MRTEHLRTDFHYCTHISFPLLNTHTYIGLVRIATYNVHTYPLALYRYRTSSFEHFRSCGFDSLLVFDYEANTFTRAAWNNKGM